MAKKKKQNKNKSQEQSTVTDPYTGEEKPPIPNSDKFVEVVPHETADRKGQRYLLNEETSMDAFAADADAEDVSDLGDSYTEDADVEADFKERQGLAASGRKILEEELDEHHSLSPEISGGDLDAAWQDADQAGEETVGGSVATPDQDRVDEIGKAAGLTYNDDEPLNYDKMRERDRKRWELNPASGLEQNQELEDVLEDIEEDEEQREASRKKAEKHK